MIEIRTLGRTSVAVDGDELTGEAAWPRSLALLVYLAREPGPDRRDDVLGVLWPDREEKRARHALNQLLYTLRKASPQLDLESLKDRIDFATEVWLDVDEFERRLEAGDLEGALELYEGPFLSDLIVDVAEFEHWADRQRALLARKFRKAALELMGRAKEAGDYGRALAHARRLVRVDPLDDEAQHALIECLYLSGDRTGALRQYEEYRALLARELEVEPLEATVKLVERIRGEAGAPGRGGEGVEATGIETKRRPKGAETTPSEPAVAAAKGAAEDKAGGARPPEPEVAGAPSPGAKVVAPTPSEHAARGAPRVGRLVAAAVTGAVVGAGLMFWFGPSAPAPPGMPPTDGVPGFASTPVRIAVVPFQVRGAQGPKEAEMGAQISQLLGRNLNGLGPLQALDAATVQQGWTDAGLDAAEAPSTDRLAELGRELGADAVLAGTLHAGQTELRVTADLVSVETGQPVVSGDARGAPGDLLALADRLALDLVRRLWSER